VLSTRVLPHPPRLFAPPRSEAPNEASRAVRYTNARRLMELMSRPLQIQLHRTMAAGRTGRLRLFPLRAHRATLLGRVVTAVGGNSSPTEGCVDCDFPARHASALTQLRIRLGTDASKAAV